MRPESSRYLFSVELTPYECIKDLARLPQDDIVLEIPLEHPVLRSYVALKWLAVQFEKMGKNIAIDMEDAETAQLLRDSGLNSINKTPVSQKKLKNGAKKNALHDLYSADLRENNDDTMKNNRFIQPKKYGRQRQTIPVMVWLGIAAAVIALFLLTVVLPRAQVVIIPESSETTLVKSVSIKAVSEIQKDPKVVRGKTLKADIHVESTTQVTELSQTGDAAQGEVLITNQTGQEVNLPAQSLLMSEDGVEYLFMESVVVPPAIVLKDNTIKYGTLRVPVRAKERGVRSNRNEGKLVLQAVPLHRRERVYAEIVTPIKGGKDEEGRVVGEEGVAAAREILQRELADKITNSLKERTTHEWITDDKLHTATVTEEIVMPPLGTVADDFTLRITAASRALAIAREDIVRLFNLSGDECGSGEGDSRFCMFQAVKVRSLNIEAGTGEADIKLTRTKFAEINGEEAVNEVKGLSIAEARRALLAKPGVKDVRINMQFNLRGFIPRDASKISITIEKK